MIFYIWRRILFKRFIIAADGSGVNEASHMIKSFISNYIVNLHSDLNRIKLYFALIVYCGVFPTCCMLPWSFSFSFSSVAAFSLCSFLALSDISKRIDQSFSSMKGSFPGTTGAVEASSFALLDRKKQSVFELIVSNFNARANASTAFQLRKR